MTRGNLPLPLPMAGDRARAFGRILTRPSWVALLLPTGLLLGLAMLRFVAGEFPTPAWLSLAIVGWAAALGGARVGCLSAGLTLIATAIAGGPQPDTREQLGLLAPSVLAVALVVGLVRTRTQQQLALLRRELAEARATTRQLEALSRIDHLTEVANRRWFDVVLVTEWRRSRRSGQPLAVLLIDIDRFKAYNDAYGHLAGDQALWQVATCLRSNLRRPADLVARYGGEEFVVLLPETDASGACAVAERLRQQVLALGLPQAATVGGSLTISVGTAMAATTERAATEVVATADRALFAAKRAGRNQVKHATAARRMGPAPAIGRPATDHRRFHGRIRQTAMPIQPRHRRVVRRGRRKVLHG